MNVVIFGASGMVGGGALVECLEDPGVDGVLTVGRRSLGRSHPKLRQLLVEDLFALGAAADQLAGYDACFYCVGVSSAGVNEDAYRRVTLDMTVAVADLLARASPDLVMCFVSGQGTDGTGSGRVMWARVKGQAENALFEGPLDTYAFRPGFIQPLKGVQSATKLYRTLYAATGPLFPVLRRAFPGSVTTSVAVGRAMLEVARNGFERRVLETRDINAAAERGS